MSYTCNRKKCLRCPGTMQSKGREKIQLGEQSLISGSWSNILAGSLEVSIYMCMDCGNIEFYADSLIENIDALPQKTCPNCGSVHDFDYPKCPNCKFEA